jgi:Flp pilus assembly protein TadG
MRTRSRSLRRRDEGQALVEFGLVVPALLLVLTGIFSFGIILSQYEVLTDAVSAGARAFALSRLQTTPALAESDPCAYAIQVLEAAAPNLHSSSMTFAITYTNNKTNPATVSNYTTSCTSLSDNMNSDDQVQIQVTYPVTPLVFKWATQSLNMSSSATELVN